MIKKCYHVCYQNRVKILHGNTKRVKKCLINRIKEMRVPELTFIYDRKKLSSKTTKGVVELRISLGKERKYISTGIKLYSKEWKQGSVVGRTDWKDVNDRLQMFKSKCSEVILKMMEGGELNMKAIPDLLRDSIVRNGTFLDYAKNKASIRYRSMSDGTRKHYELAFRWLDEWKGIVEWEDLTERNIIRMDDKLKEQGLKEVSRWSYHKVVKSFILQGMAEGLIKRNPYANLKIKKGGEDGLTRYLSPEEFHRFETCEIDDKCLERVRDLFVFQTYTMMSYADMEKFDSNKCLEVNGQTCYKAKRVKTKQEFVIVLLPKAKAILAKYGNVLPMISNVKYNLYLKAAVKYAQIDKKVTTHWARHTGATLMLNEGHIPMHIVQHILGHASIRETEKTYAKVLDTTIVNAMVGFRPK